ncbi:hypothetical protein BDR05DRAFT_953109 [Suillus weaverae]|nr:hypothetical protein BDR05DRAFT_953109 [Suillus weaverae]
MFIESTNPLPYMIQDAIKHEVKACPQELLDYPHLVWPHPITQRPNTQYHLRFTVIGFPIVYYGATDMPPHQHAPKAAAASITAPIPTPIIAAAAAPILATASITPIAIAAFTNPC